MLRRLRSSRRGAPSSVRFDASLSSLENSTPGSINPGLESPPVAPAPSSLARSASSSHSNLAALTFSPPFPRSGRYAFEQTKEQPKQAMAMMLRRARTGAKDMKVKEMAESAPTKAKERRRSFRWGAWSAVDPIETTRRAWRATEME